MGNPEWCLIPPDNFRFGFPLANGTPRALNSIMSEDVSAAPAGEIGGSLFGEMVHSKMWRRAWLFSVVAGVAAVALHLSGEADSGKLRFFFQNF